MNSETPTLGRVILVTGPAKSGKSEWAENLAFESGKPVIYLATAKVEPTDSEWVARIERHRDRRPPNWVTLSEPQNLVAAITTTPSFSCLLIDSLGTWVANLLEEDNTNWDSTERLGNLVRRLGAIAHPVYLVTGGHVLNLSTLGFPLPTTPPFRR